MKSACARTDAHMAQYDTTPRTTAPRQGITAQHSTQHDAVSSIPSHLTSPTYLRSQLTSPNYQTPAHS
jgi:hypothetical protein